MENKITKVKKRDGSIVNFDIERITSVIFKALTATSEGNGNQTKKLANKIVKIINLRFKKGALPHVEQIQDIVEETLILNGLVETAKAYILYREQRRRIRESVTKMDEASETIDKYIQELDWQVKENANMAYSLQGLNQFTVSFVSKNYWLNKIYPKEIREAAEGGDFHLHNLDSIAPYCAGWDLYDLLVRGFGGVAGKVETKPAKHFRTALGQAVNFLYTITGEVAGAVAFSNFDTLLAPFIRYDSLNYPQVKQCLQEFLFNMSVPTRVGFQNPFSNVTLDLKVSPVFAKMPVVIGGRPQEETYADFQEEMDMFNRAFYECMMEGDAHGRVFSVDGDCFCPIKNPDKTKLVKIGDYIDNLMAKNSPIFIKENNCQVLDVRDLNLKCLGSKDGLIDWQRINFLVRHPANALLKIFTVGGFNIRVTPSHSVLVLKNGLIQSFEASKLNPGDYLVAPKTIPQKEEVSEISLAAEFVKKGKEKEIYIRNVFKQREIYKEARPIIHKRNYGKMRYQYTYKTEAFPLENITSKLSDFDLSKAELSLAGSNIKIGNNLTITKELVEFLGWYCAEGSAEKNEKYGGISLAFNLKKEKSTAVHIGKLAEQIWPGMPIKFREIKARNLIELRIHSKLLRRVITEVLRIGNGGERRVPDIIFQLSPAMKKIFLTSYFNGDAWITENIVVNSASRELIYGISTTLKQLDIFHTLTEYSWKGRLRWRINIWRDSQLKPKDSHIISKIPIKESGIGTIVKKILTADPYYRDSLGRKYRNKEKTILGKFGMANQNSVSLEKAKGIIKLARKLNIEIPTALQEIEKNNLLFLRVKKIQKTKATRGMVYDFSTESENFVADQFLVHNTFPIPTINITSDFDWENPVLEPMWEATAKYGVNYFSNYINSDMKPEDIRAMCCRLRIDKRELYNRGGGGLFGSGALTGSLGVVTINLPRIGYLSKTKSEFFERLKKVMDIAKESLEIKRKVLENFMEKGLYPYSRHYLAGVKKMRDNYFGNHFSTIGLVGMNEALINFLGENIASKRGQKFTLSILDFMRGRLIDYQKETGNLYNLEQSPAEAASYRLALKDREKYPGIITAGTQAVGYYTNSTQLPVGYTDDVFEALRLQDEIQSKYTGGCVLHLFLGERLSDAQSVKALVRRVFEKHRLPYITITPTFSICPSHGYISGEHFYCPECTIKQPCEVYSRIVGYLRPLQQWHIGKRQEYRDRKEFRVKVAQLKGE